MDAILAFTPTRSEYAWLSPSDTSVIEDTRDGLLGKSEIRRIST
jgi:hypothetical protein